MRVLVAMSGGVDSSVAAALLARAGHDVVGATMKLWGGPSDSGCCSVADVEDARRVARQIGVDHHVFNFGDDFERAVVGPYAADHLAGRTPNPCVECNRHIKFDRFLRRARILGFDAIATGHHARIRAYDGRYELHRGCDPAKDQSYVLSMLGQGQLARVLLPVGEMTKQEVRALAGGWGLRTASKPDSQDVCFITSSGGRAAFLQGRGTLHAGRLVDSGTGSPVGSVEAVELVTVGQRRGMGIPGHGRRRYAVDVDVATRTVTVGGLEELMADHVSVGDITWSAGAVAPGTPVDVQVSAHGAPVRGRVGEGRVEFDVAQRRVASGQTVALYDGDRVLGSAVAR